MTESLLVMLGKETIQVCNKIFLKYGGVLVVLVLTIGCAKKHVGTHEANRGGVSGIITIDGKPLRGGTISFVLVKDQMYNLACPILPDGTFKAGNAPLGEVLVAIETESQRLNNPNGYVPIPKKYSNTKTSGLKVTITKDDPEGQKLTFDLKSK
jgi:hypothetical protein